MQVWSKSFHLFRRYRVGKPNLISYHGLVTLKMRSRSPKSNQLSPPSQPCICASLVKIHPLVQKISRRKEATRTPTGSAPKTMSLRLGDIKIFFPRSRRPMIWNVGMKHQAIELYKVCINHDPGMTLTYFTAR